MELVDIEDVTDEFGVKGRGYYAGIQLTRVIYETAAHKPSCPSDGSTVLENQTGYLRKPTLTAG